MELISDGADPELRVRHPAPWRLFSLLAVLAFAAAIIPTLGWLEFAYGSENLVVASVMEMARGGPVLIPTLQGEPRQAKPPLTTWLESTVTPPGLSRLLNDRDPAVRATTYTQFAFHLRIVALASVVLMLLLVAELGRAVGNNRIGLLAPIIAASSVLLLRFGRYATTDVQLALWVTCTNVMLARGALTRRWGTSLPLAGAALGLAMMSKGPVAIIQTLVPLACFLVWRRRTERHARLPSTATERSASAWGVVLGLSLFALFGLPWFIYVAWHDPTVWPRWWSEITRRHATDIEPGAWYSYLSILPYMLPWTAYVLGGLAMALLHFHRPPNRRLDGLVLAAMLAVVPLLVMTLAKDKNERYELPMLGPFAVTAAFALNAIFERRGRLAGIDRILAITHIVIVAAAAIGLGVAGGVILKTVDGQRWFAPAPAIGLVVLGVAIFLVTPFALARPWRLVIGTLLLSLLGQFIFFRAYKDSAYARSPLRPLAEQIRTIEAGGQVSGWPRADIWYFDPRPSEAPAHGYARRTLPVDLSIYLNRIVQTAWDQTDLTPRPWIPCFAVSLQRPDEAAPAVPSDWTAVAQVAEPPTPKGARIWRAFKVPSQ